MGGKAIDPDDFEAKYRDNPDPWYTWTSPFEAHKRRMLLAACGPGRHGRVLELACGSGATTAALAKRALRLDAVDSSPSALAAAAERLGEASNVRLLWALLPAGMPRGPYDLIVVSELAYYLSPRSLDRLCTGIARALAPGGRLVLLHHHLTFRDAVQHPNGIHGRMLARWGATFGASYRVGNRRWQAVGLYQGSGRRR